jgi:hypothetical protein
MSSRWCAGGAVEGAWSGSPRLRAPDFRDWIETLEIPFVPLGPEVRSTAKPHPAQARLSAEQILQMIEGTVATQFETIPAQPTRGKFHYLSCL